MSERNWHRLGTTALLLVSLYAFFVPLARSQEQNIAALLEELKQNDDARSERAEDRLVKMGPQVGPALVAFVQKEKGCRGRIFALGVLVQVDPGNPVIAPELVRIVQGLCAFSARKDYMMRQGAAALMGMTPEGIEALSRLLKDYRFGRGLFVRRSAAFTFDERAKAMDDVSPQVVGAIISALPSLAEARADKDHVVAGTAEEALERFTRAPQKGVAELASRLLRARAPGRGPTR